MKKQGLLIAAIMLMAMQGFARTNNAPDHSNTLLSASENDRLYGYSLLSDDDTKDFTRGNGFVIRPELYRGIFADFGYQITPHVQAYFGIGYSDGLDGVLGIRAYTGKANWAAMFDVRFSLTNFVLPGASFVAGASYKDLDFGAGLKYYTDGYYYLIAPTFTIGWNIRCYDHR